MPLRADFPADPDGPLGSGADNASGVLVDALPDLALLVGRDGVIVAQGGALFDAVVLWTLGD